jgi:glycosyltransferase involved in cell wall biosynthesis
MENNIDMKQKSRQVQKGKSKKKILFVGCSGYGNTGDDIYPLVLKKYLADYDLIFENSDPPRIVPKNIFALIIGPGGLIYDDPTHFAYICEYMDSAIAKHKKIIFLSVGVQSRNLERWKRYFDYATLITVRSTQDLEVLKNYTQNPNLSYFPDLAYLFRDFKPILGLPEKFSIFTPVNLPSPKDKALFLSTKSSERVLLQMGSLKDTRYIFQKWQKLGKSITLTGLNPSQTNYVFSKSQYVYTARYHGIILSRINAVPHKLLSSNLLKLRFEDTSSDYTRAIEHINQIKKNLEQRNYSKNISKLRIAIFHDDFSLSGGGEVLVSILANELQNRNYDVTIYTFDVSDETKKIIPKGLHIIKLRTSTEIENVDYIKRYLFSTLDVSKKHDFFIFSGHSSICAAKKHKPNLLYAHNVPITQPKFPKKHPDYVSSFFEKNITDEILKNKLVISHTSESQSQQNVTSEVKKSLSVTNEKITQKSIQQSPNLNNSIRLPFFERAWIKAHKFKLKVFKTPILPFFIANKIDTLRFTLVSKHNKKKTFPFIKLIAHQKTHDQNMKHIQNVVTNSINIQQKIKNRFSRESKIIYPPIYTNQYECDSAKRYWMSLNRIVPAKRIELQLEAFQKMPKEKLYVVGHIEDLAYYRYLESIKPKNVIFLGVIEEYEKKKMLSQTQGLIFTAKDEDFGMSVVEAMASGKPVIAPFEGGCKETIIHGRTGYLVANISPNLIVKHVKIIQNNLKKNKAHYIQNCKDRARFFDTLFFVDGIVSQIEHKDK